MNIGKEELINKLDNLLLKEIVHDIVSGTLLLQADDQTLDMMLTHIWEMKSYFTTIGVIIGEA
jgi:hypothetical protein|tara:strand:- start:231 stop:419 length:189 start_codon:yes stop_codon:yes gene_type:complete